MINLYTILLLFFVFNNLVYQITPFYSQLNAKKKKKYEEKYENKNMLNKL